jgi:hypothetical protein
VPGLRAPGLRAELGADGFILEIDAARNPIADPVEAQELLH